MLVQWLERSLCMRGLGGGTREWGVRIGCFSLGKAECGRAGTGFCERTEG